MTIERPPASAVVLAGGRARRFGASKLSVLVGGIPLLHRAVLAVAAASAEIIVVVRPGGAPELPATSVPIRLVPDPEPDGGPLVALAAGLRVATFPEALVVGGDMPSLKPGVLAAMLERLEASGRSAVLLEPPDSSAPRQTLPMAVDTTTALAAADATLAAGRRSLQALLDALEVIVLPAEQWLRLDPAAGTLDDVDEPADLERLGTSWLDQHGSGEGR